MEEGLYNQILSHLKEGHKLNFELACNSPSEGPIIYSIESKLPNSIDKKFLDWVNFDFVETLVGYELYNGGEFDFQISNDEIIINGKSSLGDISGYSDPEQNHSKENLLDRDVLEILFKKDSIGKIDIELVYLNFYCEFDYLSDKTDFKIHKSTYYDEEEYKEFDFSKINMVKLEELICQRIKDLKNSDPPPYIKFNHDSKQVQCSDSQLEVNDYISFELNIEKIKK
jgi:hypothetical protein